MITYIYSLFSDKKPLKRVLWVKVWVFKVLKNISRVHTYVLLVTANGNQLIKKPDPQALTVDTVTRSKKVVSTSEHLLTGWHA